MTSGARFWVQKFTPLLESCFHQEKKQPVGLSWRMDETYIKIKAQWKYLYRAVDKAGQTVDFLLTAHRDKKAALRFLKKAIGQHGRPVKVTIDQSGANTAALIALNTSTDADANIEIRQRKYLSNLVEQDHRAIKRMVRPMLGFQTFHSARITLQGIELMHMTKKGLSKKADAQLSVLVSRPTVLFPRRFIASDITLSFAKIRLLEIDATESTL